MDPRIIICRQCGKTVRRDDGADPSDDCISWTTCSTCELLMRANRPANAILRVPQEHFFCGGRHD